MSTEFKTSFKYNLFQEEIVYTKNFLKNKYQRCLISINFE